jgi:hypothetical protein
MRTPTTDTMAHLLLITSFNLFILSYIILHKLLASSGINLYAHSRTCSSAVSPGLASSSSSRW